MDCKTAIWGVFAQRWVKDRALAVPPWLLKFPCSLSNFPGLCGETELQQNWYNALPPPRTHGFGGRNSTLSLPIKQALGMSANIPIKTWGFNGQEVNQLMLKSRRKTCLRYCPHPATIFALFHVTAIPTILILRSFISLSDPLIREQKKPALNWWVVEGAGV